MRVDFMTNTIIVTKEFYRAAQEWGTEEYTALNLAQTENPQMRVAFRSVKAAKRTNENKGLTYRYMRKFISVMDNENLRTFEETILHYESFGYENGKVYQYVKDWFLDNYPNHKELIVSAAPQRVSKSASAAAGKFVAAGNNAA